MMPCLFCGRPAEHRHHPTATLFSGGRYLDAAWTVPICARCHATEHASWRQAGIASIDDPLEARLTRNTWLIGRLIDLGRPVTFGTGELRGLHSSMLACLGLVREGRDEESL
jgi:hypothetical protein